MFLSVDLLFFGWGKIGELYVCVSLVVRSVKVFFSGAPVLPVHWSETIKKAVYDCFFTAIAGRFFLWDFVKTDRNERTFFERVVFLLFSFYIFSLSHTFSHNPSLYFFENSL